MAYNFIQSHPAVNIVGLMRRTCGPVKSRNLGLLDEKYMHISNILKQHFTIILYLPYYVNFNITEASNNFSYTYSAVGDYENENERPV